MNTYFINNSEFIDNTILKLSIIAIVCVGDFFSFDFLKTSDDLRLYYDVTIFHPKKAFFPPQQIILRFNKGKFEGTVNAKKTGIIRSIMFP